MLAHDFLLCFLSFLMLRCQTRSCDCSIVSTTLSFTTRRESLNDRVSKNASWSKASSLEAPLTTTSSLCLSLPSPILNSPILPGTSESVHLPIKALIPGIHPIAPNGLVISDVETAEERRLFDVGNIVVKENDVQLEI